MWVLLLGDTYFPQITQEMLAVTMLGLSSQCCGLGHQCAW